MKYVKPDVEARVTFLSIFFWPLTLVMCLFGLLFREKKPSFYADPETRRQRSGKAKARPRSKPAAVRQATDVEPWDLPPEKMPWE